MVATAAKIKTLWAVSQFLERTLPGLADPSW